MSRAQFSIELVGKKEFDAALQRTIAGVRDGAERAVVAAAIEGRAEVVKSIQRGPKTGRVYDSIFRTIGGKAVPVGPRQGNGLSATHQASAPGEAPASDTGRLANSIFFERVNNRTAAFGSNLIYALYLEFGTRKIAARPYFRPAAEKISAKFRGMIEAEIKRATQ